MQGFSGFKTGISFGCRLGESEELENNHWIRFFYQEIIQPGQQSKWFEGYQEQNR